MRKTNFSFVLSPLCSDLIAKNRQTGIPFSSAPLRFRTIQRELGRWDSNTVPIARTTLSGSSGLMAEISCSNLMADEGMGLTASIPKEAYDLFAGELHHSPIAEDQLFYVNRSWARSASDS